MTFQKVGSKTHRFSPPIKLQGVVQNPPTFMKIIPAYLLLLVLPLSQANAQSTIEVTTLADEDDGANALDNVNDISLREAIANAPNGATITFNPSLANGTIVLTEGTLRFDAPDNLLIDGSDLDITIQIEEAPLSPPVLVIRADATIQGLTFDGGTGVFLSSLKRDDESLPIYREPK